MRDRGFVLVPLLVAAVGTPASAQFERAREAVAQVEVVDAAYKRALEILKQDIPAAKKKEKLSKLKIRQDYRLLVCGVAIRPHEIVTRALHPRAQLHIRVTFANGERSTALMVGNDPRSNLALIRTKSAAPAFLDPEESPVVDRQKTYLVGYRGEEALEADAWVTRVSMGASCEDIYQVRGGKPLPIGSVFVVATTGRRVNPGAACLDSEGRLVGILLGCAPPQALRCKQDRLKDLDRSFVIPCRRVRTVVAALRAHGRVIRADFGFDLEPVSAALCAQIPNVREGAGTITKVEEKGPAKKAGLRRHDILLGVNGETAPDVHRLREVLEHCGPGEEVRLRVLRAGEEREVSVTPVRSE